MEGKTILIINVYEFTEITISRCKIVFNEVYVCYQVHKAFYNL